MTEDIRETTPLDLLTPVEVAPARGGWLRILRANKPIWMLAAAAAVCLVAGLLVGRFLISPADAAALTDPPEPGLITVPVESGVLRNDVTLRGEVAYADAVDVTLDTSALDGPAIVTGSVPEVGAIFSPLSIALAVSGRPVIVLPGTLPSYRTLAFGMSGPDVVQFKEAMASVGIEAGDASSDLFDATAAHAVTALYEKVGYPAPQGVDGTGDNVRAAEASVRNARQALESARSELAQTAGGPSAVDVRAADNAVAAAQRAVEVRRSQHPSDPAEVAGWAADVADLEDTLALRRLERGQLDVRPNTSPQTAAVDAARQQLAESETALQRARESALPELPAGEVLFLSDLPRRVDTVNAVRGQALTGAAMIVSGATLTLSGSASPSDAALLTVGGSAAFDLPGGGTGTATITELTPGKTATDRWTVTLQPEGLSDELTTPLQGQNVRVVVAVGATNGDVLSVPTAALSAGPGGEARVEVVDGDPKEGTDARTRLVVVETGLAASGSVEITPVDGELGEGDLVVVGR